MNETAKLLTTLLLLFGSAVTGRCVAGEQNTTHEMPPDAAPNIIFILTDDQRWDALGFAGNQVIHTPEMDKLAAEGVYFRNAFVTSPICAAARASFLTGMYERTHKYTFQQGEIGREFMDTSYPALMQQSGYYTGYIGKFGVNYASDSDLFDVAYFFDRNTGYRDRRGYFYKTIEGDTVHLTRYTGHQATDFIKNAPKDRPFNLTVSFSAPHAHDPSPDQFYWQPEVDTLYRNHVFEQPRSAAEEYFLAQPEFVRNGFNRTRWHWRFDTPEKYQQSMMGYYRMISGIDLEIGKIREVLESEQIADNTIIIFMSDNGYFIGERQLAGKWLLYEPSIRVPLIIYDPGNRDHRAIEDLVTNIDIASTILDYAGLDIPPVYEGVSLAEYTKGGNPAGSREYFLVEHLWDFENIPPSEGVRAADWKYFRYRNDMDHEELYHLVTDPDETRNLAGMEEYQNVLDQMRIKTDSLIVRKEPRPALSNILWISVEDIGPDLGAYGATGIETPNIDRLAREGILYKHAYATVGVCAPSRSSIITGMYPVSIGSHHMRTGPHASFRHPDEETYLSYYGLYDQKGRNVPQYATVPPPFVKVFTEYLRKAGYFTTNNAKTDYQFNAPVTAWDRIGRQAHYMDRPEETPFFAVFNDHITHESRIWMKKDDPMLVDPEKVPVPAYFPEIPSVVEAVSRNYSNITELDQNVGRLLDELEAEGLLEETVIFFWSDHGGPLLRQKRAVGNSGLHVPLIVRLPGGEKAGTIVEDIVSLMDLGPTVLSLAGIEPPEYMHGRAFLGPYKTKQPHRYAFGSADRFDEVYDMSRSVIDGRYVYIRNFRPELPLVYRNEYREQIEMTAELIEMDRQGELQGDAAYIFMKTKPLEELYDLHNDPWEVDNLADCPDHQEKLIELRTALSEWQLEVGDMGFIPEHDLVQMMWPGLVQPVTEPVAFRLENGRLAMKSATRGASIAWQVSGEDEDDYWRLYHQPVEISEGDVIRARAVRIGYKTSGVRLFEH